MTLQEVCLPVCRVRSFGFSTVPFRSTGYTILSIVLLLMRERWHNHPRARIFRFHPALCISSNRLPSLPSIPVVSPSDAGLRNSCLLYTSRRPILAPEASQIEQTSNHSSTKAPVVSLLRRKLHGESILRRNEKISRARERALSF